MNTDPIVAEVRKFRERLAAKFNYDIDAILRDARSREQQSGHEIVTLKPRKPKMRRKRNVITSKRRLSAETRP